MQLGIFLADAPASLPFRDHLDLLLRQLDAGQSAGFTWFLAGHHYLYGDIRWPQPIPLLARLAAELGPGSTLGTGTLVAPLVHPVALAEDAATLDQICGGRFVLGLGAGYRRGEFDALGVPFEERGPRLEQCVRLLRRLWTDEVVEHDGPFWALRDARPHLRPCSPGGPAVWLGAKSDGAVRRAARVGDSWLVPSKLPVHEVQRSARAFQAVREELGLPTPPLPMLRYISIGRDRDDALALHVRRTADRLDAYEARGLDLQAAGDGRETRDPLQVAVLGDVDDCVRQLTELAARVPVGPVVTRVAWPGMDVHEVERCIKELAPVVAALADVTPVTAVPAAAHRGDRKENLR